MTTITQGATLNNVDSKDYQPNTIELTNAGDGTNEIIWDARTFRATGVQFNASGGSGTKTLKFFGSLEDVAEGSATFTDVTVLLTETQTVAGVTSIVAGPTADTIVQFGRHWGIFRWIKPQVVIASASADANVDLFPYIGY